MRAAHGRSLRPLCSSPSRHLRLRLPQVPDPQNLIGRGFDLNIHQAVCLSDHQLPSFALHLGLLYSDDRTTLHRLLSRSLATSHHQRIALASR